MRPVMVGRRVSIAAQRVVSNRARAEVLRRG
jgi:hypothetical protein